MAQEERTAIRDRSYSAWHRRQSIWRFVGWEKAQTLSMIDLDASLFVEYDNATKEPIALMETAVDVGQQWKTATVTAKLARRANMPAFSVLYKLSDAINPGDPIHKAKDIVSFRVRRLYPEPSPEKHVSPEVWAKCLVNIRNDGAARLDELWKNDPDYNIQF